MKKKFGKLTRVYLTEDNQIELWYGIDTKTVFDFNTYYDGSYPKCHFTAVGVGDGLVYAAGTSVQGIPCLFSSKDGEVWTQVGIAPRLPLTKESAYGDIVQILYDNASRQLFLATGNGYLITIPDCPKCVRVRLISALPIKAGKIEGDTIYLYDTQGDCLTYSLALAVQYRCSFSYAEPHIGKDGVMLDLRSQQDAKERPIYGAVIFPEEKIDEFLKQYSKEMYVFFLCEKGIKADDAVREARAKGFEKAYSLGGILDIIHFSNYNCDSFSKFIY